MSSLADRLREALAGSPLATQGETARERYCELRGDDAAAKQLDDAVVLGLARLLATQPETALYLGNRPGWLEEAATLEAGCLDRRGERFAGDEERFAGLELEDALDALRLRRRDETALAGCADLAALAAFEEVSEYLSLLAENTARIALDLARRNLPGPDLDEAFAVIGMGKIAGREFTYHSDLDLIFLFRGGSEEIDRATRIGQRLVSYLTTMTGAGIAYAVDTRLRPSGQQGMLVTSFEGYERYQIDQAATWEHLAMLRARPIAGACEEAALRLAHVREQLLPIPEPFWAEIADLRQRVVDERAGSDPASAFKTGRGGLMDVDFLAAGGLLERGASEYPACPSVPAMLRAVAPGEASEALLSDYRGLREIEACVRWVAGRGIETLPDELGLAAELAEPGLDADALRERVARLRERIRTAYDAVIAAESIGALDPA